MDSNEFTTGCPMDATPVQPTSLDDTLPVGDVHAATTAGGSVSNHEVRPPANFKTRQLKITDAPIEGSHPGLRIQGRWLAEAGFSVGGHVQISVSWQHLLIEVLRPDFVTQRPTTREERHLALKETLLSRRTEFATTSHLTRSRDGAPQHGVSHTRYEGSASRVEDCAVPAVPHASRINTTSLDPKFTCGTWPDRISALLKPALGDILHQEQTKRRLRPESISARAQVSQSGYTAIERGNGQPNLSKFIAIAWALDRDPRVLFDKLLTQMGFPEGVRPVM